MDEIKEVVVYVREKFEESARWTAEGDSDPSIIKSALVYQFLYKKYKNHTISVHDVLEMYGGEIGLIGPGNGGCTCVLERVFGGIETCKNHAILHDAYGRFYNKYGAGRGYCYMLKDGPKMFKKNPMFGHVMGMIISSFIKF